jgi:RNA polymerase sigma factor (sigma-70 family)
VNDPGHPSAHSRHGRAQFATTHWSAVVSAGRADSPQSAEALTQLCQAYWFPLYAYVRRRGNAPEDAQDLTQAFFERLIEKNWLADIEPTGGRFRSFLLTAMNRFLANEYDRNRAAKRGGGQPLVSLDTQEAEHRYTLEAATEETPERIFERRWALEVLDHALAQLQIELTRAGKARNFDRLQPFLSQEPATGDYAAAAAELGVTSGAIGVAVHRLRHRYRELVRAEIAATLADPTAVDLELQHLFAALRG